MGLGKTAQLAAVVTLNHPEYENMINLNRNHVLIVFCDSFRLPRCLAPRMSACRLKCGKQTLVVATVRDGDGDGGDRYCWLGY
jgi:hypothetical protein